MTVKDKPKWLTHAEWADFKAKGIRPRLLIHRKVGFNGEVVIEHRVHNAEGRVIPRHFQQEMSP